MHTFVQELKKSMFAEGLDDNELEKLCSIAESKTFFKSEKIFDEKDKTSSLYFLVEGRIRIERKAFPKRHLFIPQIQIVKHGQIFGEMAFLDNVPRSAIARAAGSVRVIIFDSEKLHQLLTMDANLGYKVMGNIARIISRRLRRMNDHWLSAVGSDFVIPEFEYSN
jgi:CRP-like cAMP-binding protein